MCETIVYVQKFKIKFLLFILLLLIYVLNPCLTQSPTIEMLYPFLNCVGRGFGIARARALVW